MINYMRPERTFTLYDLLMTVDADIYHVYSSTWNRFKECTEKTPLQAYNFKQAYEEDEDSIGWMEVFGPWLDNTVRSAFVRKEEDGYTVLDVSISREKLIW